MDRRLRYASFDQRRQRTGSRRSVADRLLDRPRRSTRACRGAGALSQNHHPPPPRAGPRTHPSVPCAPAADDDKWCSPATPPTRINLLAHRPRQAAVTWWFSTSGITPTFFRGGVVRNPAGRCATNRRGTPHLARCRAGGVELAALPLAIAAASNVAVGEVADLRSSRLIARSPSRFRILVDAGAINRSRINRFRRSAPRHRLSGVPPATSCARRSGAGSFLVSRSDWLDGDFCRTWPAKRRRERARRRPAGTCGGIPDRLQGTRPDFRQRPSRCGIHRRRACESSCPPPALRGHSATTNIRLCV